MLVAHVLGVLTDFALKAYQIKLKLTQFNKCKFGHDDVFLSQVDFDYWQIIVLFYIWLKGVYNIGKNENINAHRFAQNLHGTKMVMVENFPWNSFAWNGIVFRKWVKQ